MERPLTKRELEALQNRTAQLPKSDDMSDASFKETLEESGCGSCYETIASICTMASYIITCCGCCTSWDDWTDDG